MAIKRILVPVDFSAPSLQALEYAADLGKRFGAELVLIHVVEPIYYAADPFGTGDILGAALDEVQGAGREQLNRLATGLRKRRLAVATVVRVGPPSHTIVQVATQRGTHLIVMSTHGRTGVSHLLMGSVAEGVVRTAGCPVLTVRALDRDPKRARRRATRSR